MERALCCKQGSLHVFKRSFGMSAATWIFGLLSDPAHAAAWHGQAFMVPIDIAFCPFCGHDLYKPTTKPV